MHATDRHLAAAATAIGLPTTDRHLADALAATYTREELYALHYDLVDDLDLDAPREDPIGRLVDAIYAAGYSRPGCTCDACRHVDQPPQIRRFTWHKLPPEQGQTMIEIVRSFGLDPDFIATDFTLVRYGSGPWHLHLTEFERSADGRRAADGYGPITRPVVRQINPPAFLTEETRHV